MLACKRKFYNNTSNMLAQEFAYRPVLEELTVEVNDKGLDPFEAYVWLVEQEQKFGLHANDYCSTSITSGGHARNNDLAFQEVVKRNTRSAALLGEQLAQDKQIRPESAVEPVFVGKTHWNQAEFMEFWLSVIGGYELTSGFMARDIDNLRQATRQAGEVALLDRGLMVSKASAEVRAAEYFKMSTAFAQLIKQGVEARPIPRVIRMIDTEQSLGAQTERTFARLIGSKVMNILPIKIATIEDIAVVNRTLAEDTKDLIQYGSVVFDIRSNTLDTSLLLVEDESAA